MAIDTNLNQSPYFDDFSEDKNFHRVLFRPGYAVQARELTQLQTILQNQIERFAGEILIDGTVVTGVGLTTDSVSHIKLRDKDANNRVILLGDFKTGSAIANLTVTGATTGLTARLVTVEDGSEAADPNFLTAYVHYTNSGANNTTKVFNGNETLLFRHTANSTFKFAANTITANATGTSLKANISDGIIYHKGHFIRCPSQSVIVGKYTETPDKKIGITTTETIIDSNQDSSLLDNASGATNFAAPGSNRLKLDPQLVCYDYYFANTDNFFTIATVKDGSVEQRNTETVYSDIGTYIAERLYDTNGNYVVDPFNLRVREHLKKTNSLGRYTTAEGGDENKLVVEVEKGRGYVNGYQIALNGTSFLDVDKATDYISTDALSIGQAFGHYVNAREVVGSWDFSNLKTVSLRGVPQQAISSKTYGSHTVEGAEIGTAKVRGFQWDSGTPGTYNGRFRIYLFNIIMNSGSSFADVRSLYINNASGPKSYADIILETNGTAKIQESGLNTMVFPLGQKGTKTLKDATDTVDTQFVVRKRLSSVSFDATGSATFGVGNTHPGGTESITDTGSPISNVDERNYLIISTTATATDNHTGQIGAISGNTITANSGADFSTTYQVGDIITITDGGNTYNERITEVVSPFTLKVANTMPVTRTGVGLAHKTTFPTGYIWDLSSNGTITATSSSVTVDLGQSNLQSFTSEVYYNVTRTDANPTKKTVFEDKYIHINFGSHSATTNGPWSLGVSDAFKLQAVYLGSNTGVTTSSTDVTKEFELDTGMKDAFYDTSFIKLKDSSTLSLSNAQGALVKFSYFGRDTSTGYGFLSVDSYADIIDDRDTANTSAITTQEIPKFISPTSGKTYDLRNSIDFRPKKSNSITPSSIGTVASAPTNPAVTSGFSYTVTSGVYNPTPDESFQCDAQFYLPRKDRVTVSQRGTFEVVKGTPDLTPKTPPLPAGTMSLGVLEIPVYPSLSPYVARQYNRSDYNVKLTVDNNRRYTMEDLRAVESRVKTLEYYSSLNALETAAKNKQLFNEAGTDRFKNGFLVDNFDGHNVADTNNPNYRAAIDRREGRLRPTFQRSDISFSLSSTLAPSNVVQTGNLITLNYTNEVMIDQNYATKLRNPVQELLFNWRGQVVLNPEADNTPDITTLPDIQIDFDGIFESMEAIAEASGIVGGVDFGNWNVVGGERREGGRIVRDVERTVTETSISVASETISLGNLVQDVSVREYMRSRSIEFTGVRMKPNTRVYAYFDDEKVSEYCTPANSSFVTTGSEGDALVTDSTGTVYGLFRIPNDDDLKFRSGTKRFLLSDIADPTVEADLVTTSAHGEYTSNALDISQRGGTVDITFPQIAKETRVERRQQWTVLDRDNGWQDPIAQTFSVNMSGSTEGVYITKIDLYFGRKSSTLPITLQIREMETGFPTDTIVPYGQKTLQASQVNTSADGSTATTFQFDTPCFLRNNTNYAMVVIPGGNSDDYAVWCAQLGQEDVITSTLVSKQPYTGVLFTSSNDNTWSPIQSEDMKFKIHRAKFNTSSSGTMYLENDDLDYFTVGSTSGTFRIGEKVTTTGANGVVDFIDTVNNKMFINLSTGTFSSNTTITGASSGATANVVSIDNIALNTLVPKIPEIRYARTTSNWSFRPTTSAGVISTNYSSVLIGQDNHFTDNEKKIFSKSNESGLSAVGGSTKTGVIRGVFSTGKDTLSPVIDVSRANGILIKNNINNDGTEEHKGNGNALVRYITRPIELEDGQEAEDLVVYLSAYKPRTTDIDVYAKILNGEDGESLSDKDFTPLRQVTAANTFSEGLDGLDIREFEFTFTANTDGSGLGSTSNNHAYLNSANNNVVSYNGKDGSVYHSYKTFAIKIVMTSQGTNIVPLARDMRAIALQK